MSCGLDVFAFWFSFCLKSCWGIDCNQALTSTCFPTRLKLFLLPEPDPDYFAKIQGLELSIDRTPILTNMTLHPLKQTFQKASQELRMLPRSFSDCQSLTLNDKIRASQFVRNSQLCHWVATSLNHSQCLCLSLCRCLCIFFVFVLLLVGLLICLIKDTIKDTMNCPEKVMKISHFN